MKKVGGFIRDCVEKYIPAAAFAVLLILGRLGSVGLAGNGYSSPIFLLAASWRAGCWCGRPRA